MSNNYWRSFDASFLIFCSLLIAFIQIGRTEVYAADSDLVQPDTHRAAQSRELSDIEPLLEKSNDGLVRVIVEFDEGPALRGTRTLAADPEMARSAAIATTRSGLMGRLQGARVGSVRSYQTFPLVAMDTDRAGLERLARDPFVLHVHEDVARSSNLDDSLPLIGAPSLHRRGIRGWGTSVAILDTGVDRIHPALRGRIIDEACFSTSSTAKRSQSVCPNRRERQFGPGAARPCSFNGCYHGTHVAGIALGVAPRAKIVGIQVHSRFTGNCGDRPDPCPKTLISDHIAALDYVAQLPRSRRVVAANMSFGDSNSSCGEDPTRKPIEILRSISISTVIAAGNEGYQGTLGEPACINTALSVSATTKFDRVARYSNLADATDLLAPGSDIRSAVPGGGYDTASGTSFAAPHVSGALALLRSTDFHRATGLVEEALRSTGRWVQRGSIAKRRIRVDDALAALNRNRISPRNDMYRSGSVVDGTRFSITGFNNNAGVEAAEPPHAGQPGGSSIWWRWTAPVGGRVRIDTRNSAIDTLLAVYEGTSLGSLREVASNDNAPGLNPQSRVAFRVRPGESYRIAVDGQRGVQGDIMLNLDYEEIDLIQNDEFARAAVLGGRSGFVTGTNRSATKERGEPRHNGTGGGKTVWWRWQAPDTGDVVFTTRGSDFDTVLAVYNGFQVTRLRKVTSNDDYRETMGQQSWVVFRAQRGVTYRIAVDGWKGSEGDIELRFKPG